jgi:hypothetical protein
MIVEVTLLIAAGIGNLAWDVTGRRVSARARRRARHERRRETLPVPDEQANDPFAHVADGIAPPQFIELTRTIVEELDRVVDHFDLVLLRAEANHALVGDIVYIGAEAPRRRGRALLEQWLTEVAGLPEHVRTRLRDLGLPDTPLAELLERELARSRQPFAYTSQDSLTATAGELEGAVVGLVAFLRALTAGTTNPYR